MKLKRYENPSIADDFSEKEYQKMIKDILKMVDSKKFKKNFVSVLKKYEMLAPKELIRDKYFRKNLPLAYHLYRQRIFWDIVHSLVPEEIYIRKD